MSDQAVPTDERLHRLVDPPAGRIERWISWLADHSSPVLVKEIRQALKSRSFLLTYMLLLLTALIWSVMGMSIMLTEGLADAGGILLVGYLWILGFPLTIVVPLTAYRSLCREFEEDTLHLVSITTMSPRKLIIGKLVSALAQMVIYLSALAPCIAFTWLLRGLDVFQIMFAILLAVVGSASLSAAALFLASISRNPVFRIVVLVGMICGLGFVYFMWCAFRVAIQAGELDDLSIAFQMHLFSIFLMGTSGYLLLEAAASTISFPAENRSTPIRIAMMVQTVAMIALGSGMIAFNGFEFGAARDAITVGMYTLATMAIMYWLVMGSALAGESSVLSSRVRRSLPRTIIGKTFCSMFMPGGGRGYLLAVGNIIGWSLAALIIGMWPGFREMFSSLGNGASLWQLFQGLSDSLQGVTTSLKSATGIPNELDFGFTLIGLVYGLFYLNLTLLALRGLEAMSVRVNPVLGVLLLITLFALVNLGSWTAHLLYHIAIGSNYVDDYSVFLVPNVFLGYQQFMDGSLSVDEQFSCGLFAAFVGLMSVAGLFVSSRELLDRPAAVPKRVLEELQKAKRVREERGESIEDIFAERLGAAIAETTTPESTFENPPTTLH